MKEDGSYKKEWKSTLRKFLIGLIMEEELNKVGIK